MATDWIRRVSARAPLKSGMAHLATEVARRGYVGVSIRYRLQRDIRRGIDFLVEQVLEPAGHLDGAPG